MMLRTISNTTANVSESSLGSKRTLCGDVKRVNGKKGTKKARIGGRRNAMKSTRVAGGGTKDLNAEELICGFKPSLPNLEYSVDRKAWEDRRRDIEFIHYKDDLLRSWKNFEKENGMSGEFMETVQTDLKPRMLTVLYGWMIEVNSKFKNHEETLWQAMTLCNRYLSKVDVPRTELQLVGSACLWISAKYTEIYPPLAKDFVYISDNAYTREQLLEREQHICKELDYNFSGPTPYTFALRYADVATHGFPEKNRIRVKYLTLYGLERASLSYKLYKYEYSALAAAALHCALSCTGHRWSSQVEKLTGVSAKDIKPLSREIRTIVLNFENPKHKAVITKYKSKSLGSVSNLRIKGGQRSSRQC